MNRSGELSFKNVVTFNMDEYLGLPRDNDQSYWYFMHENLFDHIEIPAENINILNGMTDDPEGEKRAILFHFLPSGTLSQPVLFFRIVQKFQDAGNRGQRRAGFEPAQKRLVLLGDPGGLRLARNSQRVLDIVPQ